MIGPLIARDVRRALGSAAWLPIIFFLAVAALVPFAVGPDARLLERIGGGALWIAALTAALLPIERLVEPDRADGILDQLALHGLADESIAAAKIAAHWLTFAPLLLIAAVPGIGPARNAAGQPRARLDCLADRNSGACRARRRGCRAHCWASARGIAGRDIAAAACRAAADLRSRSDRRHSVGRAAVRVGRIASDHSRCAIRRRRRDQSL